MVKQIFRALLDIATLRRGPQDLPASGFFVGLMAVLYTLTGIVSIAVYSSSASQLLAQLVLDLVLLLDPGSAERRGPVARSTPGWHPPTRVQALADLA